MESTKLQSIEATNKIPQVGMQSQAGDNEAAAPTLPDRTSIAASADAQSSSHFFSRLPLEVRRMIYVEFWRLGSASGQHDCSGLRQHIHRHDGRLRHTPCLLAGAAAAGREAGDVRHSSFRDAMDKNAFIWEGRLRSSWGLHWPCEELADGTEILYPAEQAPDFDGSSKGPAMPEWSPFLPVMLACKRLYLECSESIYDTVTFCLTDTAESAEFLGSRPKELPCRSVDISLRMTALLTELYFSPDGTEKAVVAGGSAPVTADNNPWQRLCDVLCRTSAGDGLRDLHVWLDSSDLRPWHKRVVETRFCARLLGVRPPVGGFVVDVPLLPDDPATWGLPGCYLEDIPPEQRPFEVRRSKRTNNWLIHLSRVSHLRFTSQRP